MQERMERGLWDGSQHRCGALSYNHKELNSANNLIKLESRIFPRASGKEHGPADTLSSVLRHPVQRNLVEPHRT